MIQKIKNLDSYIQNEVAAAFISVVISLQIAFLLSFAYLLVSPLEFGGWIVLCGMILYAFFLTTCGFFLFLRTRQKTSAWNIHGFQWSDRCSVSIRITPDQSLANSKKCAHPFEQFIK